MIRHCHKRRLRTSLPHRYYPRSYITYHHPYNRWAYSHHLLSDNHSGTRMYILRQYTRYPHSQHYRNCHVHRSFRRCRVHSHLQKRVHSARNRWSNRIVLWQHRYVLYSNWTRIPSRFRIRRRDHTQYYRIGRHHMHLRNRSKLCHPPGNRFCQVHKQWFGFHICLFRHYTHSQSRICL